MVYTLNKAIGDEIIEVAKFSSAELAGFALEGIINHKFGGKKMYRIEVDFENLEYISAIKAFWIGPGKAHLFYIDRK